MSLFHDVESAVKKAKTEQGELGAVQHTLAQHGYRRAPQVKQTVATTPEGRPAGTARIYLFTDTPDGDIALVAGPSIEGRVVRPVKGGIPGIIPGTVFMEAAGPTPGREKSLAARYAERAPRAPRGGPKRVRTAPPVQAAPAWEPIAPLALPEVRQRRGGTRTPYPQEGQWVPPAGLPAPPPPAEPSDAQRMALFEQLLKKALAGAV